MQRFTDMLTKLVLHERSASKLTLSFCAGVYIAFSPFIALHTVMCIAVSWFFSLNFLVTLIVSNLVNNPWTMVPVYASDYLLGDWLLHTVFGLNTAQYNPAWMNWCNMYLTKYVNCQAFSLTAFLVGGNLLGVVAACVAYPIVKPIFKRLTAQFATKTVTK
jgi:uncharacterized protein (DUF2062 family)